MLFMSIICNSYISQSIYLCLFVSYLLLINISILLFTKLSWFISWYIQSISRIGSILQYKYSRILWLLSLHILWILIQFCINIQSTLQWLHIVSYFWFITNKNEFEKYGETKRTHETLTILIVASTMKLFVMLFEKTFIDY